MFTGQKCCLNGVVLCVTGCALHLEEMLLICPPLISMVLSPCYKEEELIQN